MAIEVLRTQLKTGLHNISPEAAGEKIWIAYEPVWSIGADGIPAPVEYAQNMHREIRGCLTELFGEKSSEIPILYGGSVNARNGKALITQPDIDGLFTTRTAFQVDAFARLIRDAIKACEQS